MEDLRVLEQQQRESQRLLASTKLAKTHKLEQRSELESKLSSLKYKNAEERANLQRSRDVLSSTTRELGAIKLRSSRAGKDLKDFEKKLRKALATAREIQLMKRKIESTTNRVDNLANTLSRMKSQAKDSLEEITMKRDDALQQEKFMTKAINDNKNKLKMLVEESLKNRTTLTALEHDLATAQQMESSTKYRVDCIAQELTQEESLFNSSKNEIESKIETTKKEKEDCNNKIMALRVEVDVKKKQLREASEKCIAYQKREGHEVSDISCNQRPILDIDRIRKTLENEEDKLRQLNMTKESKQRSLSIMEETINRNLDKQNELDRKAQALTETVDQGTVTETKRNEENKMHIEKAETERASLQDLQKSVAEIENNICAVKESGEKEVNALEEELQKEKSQYSNLKSDLESSMISMEKTREELATNKIKNTNAIEEAKGAADKAKAVFESTIKKSKEMVDQAEDDAKVQYEQMKKEQDLIVSKLKKEISTLTESK